MSYEQPKLTLHWLEQSRSHRIAWLLEELNLDYELKLYHKSPYDKSAQKELVETSPSGKSPMLEIEFPNSNQPSIKLCESGHIVNTLINYYNPEGLLRPGTIQSQMDIDYLSYLSESSISENLTFIFVLQNYVIPDFPDGDQAPMKWYIDQLNKDYNYKQLNNKLVELELRLLDKYNGNASPKQIYFVGDKLTGADILLSFHIHVIFDSGLVSGVSHGDYPLLSQWWRDLKRRPALIKANEKVLKVGNGEYPIWFGK